MDADRWSKVEKSETEAEFMPNVSNNVSLIEWELTVVLDYYEAIGTYSRIGLL